MFNYQNQDSIDF